MDKYVQILLDDFAAEFHVNPDYRFSAQKYMLRTLMNLWAVADDLDSAVDRIRMIALDAGLRPREIEDTIRHFDSKVAGK